MAAVLRAGDGAIASHATAARLWRLPLPTDDRVEITVPAERRVRIPGVRVHRSYTLREPDWTELEGIPVTAPARVIADISGRFDARVLGRAVDDGLRRRVLTLGALRTTAEQLPTIAPGRSPQRLAEVVGRRIPGYQPGDSDLETHVFETIVDAGLPAPIRLYRVTIDGRALTLDLAYPAPKLGIEVDGFDPHRTRGVFETDRIRQNALVLAGWTILRFTSDSTPGQIVKEVAHALFGRSWSP